MRNVSLSPILLMMFCFLVGVAACGTGRDGSLNHVGSGVDAGHKREPFDFSEHFAYKPLDITYGGEQCSLPLRQDEVVNLADMVSRLGLEAGTRDFLLDHGFAVTGFAFLSQCEDVVEAYEVLGRKRVPIFVTSGSLLHTYHVLFDDLLSTIEARQLYDDMWQVSLGLLEECRATYAGSDGDLAEAARRDAAFLAVGLELMKPKAGQVPAGGAEPRLGRPANPKEFEPGDIAKYAFEVPGEITDVVGAEMALIGEHRGPTGSPLFIYTEDYSQYVPRGHYTASEKLKNYFRAMMWFGRMAMLIKGTDEIAPGETCKACSAFVSRYDARIQTLGAAVISDIIGRRDELMQAWERTYRVTSFFVGFSDDLGPYEYLEAVDGVFGKRPPLDSYSPADHDKLKARLAEFGSPRIYGGTGDCLILPPFTPEQADQCLAKTRGFRLMGRRFVPDSYILSELVAPHTGAFLGGDPPFTAYSVPGVGTARVFPRGLDVMAALGSSRARDVLDALGDTHYVGYDQAFSDIKAEIDRIEESEWNKNLYWNWLWSLKAFLAGTGAGYPPFMQSDEWKDRVLKVALASWAELRHDTILYVKQSYTATLGAIPSPPAGIGYVEPVPELYNRLLSLTRMTRLGLDSMGVLDAASTRRLQALEGVLDRLVLISLTELAGAPLMDRESRYLGRFGEELSGVLSGIEEKSRKTTIVADVHTDMNSHMVLEEGVGYVDLVVVAWKSGGQVYLAAGPELSYYEFKHPMADRLTDEAWREMLASDPPARPAWLPAR